LAQPALMATVFRAAESARSGCALRRFHVCALSCRVLDR